jgi:hypothetical protein
MVELLSDLLFAPKAFEKCDVALATVDFDFRSTALKMEAIPLRAKSSPSWYWSKRSPSISSLMTARM